MISRNRGNGYSSGHGRGAASSPPSTVKVLGIRVPKKAAIGALAVSGLLAIVGPDLDFNVTRRLRLATTCIHNIYIDDYSDAVLLPPVPERGENYVPVHIKMCYEWLRRDALSVDNAIMHRVNILEHEDVCLDWTSPHYSMMEIIANSVLHTVLPRIRYRHGCPSHREYDEYKRGYDWSTFQSVLQEPAMAVNQDLVDPDLFLDQCKYCLETYDPTLDESRIRARSFHHCFAFPEESNLYKNPIVVEPVTEPTVVALPSAPNPLQSSAPISAVLRPLRARLVHSAAEWVNVTDAPPFEKSSGTVILIDPGTLAIRPDIYKDFISPDTTSIAILVGPLCYAARLPNGENCMDYANRVKDQLIQDFPQIGDTGFENGPGIDVQVTASTAGLNSRAILADDLLCPPRTASCLLPPVGKPPLTKATLLGVPCPDCPGSGIPEVKFFENVGTNDNVDVVLLPPDEAPPITENDPNPPPFDDPPQNNTDVPVAPAFPNIQQPTAGDGFPSSLAPLPSPPNLADLPTLPSQTVYQNTESKLPEPLRAASNFDPEENSPLEQTPGVIVDHSNTPGIPSAADIQQAIDERAPLDTNTPFDPEQEPEEPVDPTQNTELGTDESAGLASQPLTDENYKKLAVERRNSKDRIITGYDGNYLFEVPCPTTDDDGNAILLDDGYTLTDNGNTVSISDGHGSAIMESPVTINTVEIKEGEFTDENGETTTEEYVEIPDPITGGTVNITNTGKIGCDCDNEARHVTNEIGQLVTDPTTQQGCLLTMADARLLKRKDPNGKKTATVILGKVISAGNENMPPSDTGTVVMNPDGSYAVANQAGEFGGWLHVDPLVQNSGMYQHYMQSPLQENIFKVPFDSCKTQDFEHPIVIRAQMGSLMNFYMKQTMKGGPLSWLAVYYKSMMYFGGYDCPKYEEPGYGNIPNSIGMAWCDWNPETYQMEAVFQIYAHDGQPGLMEQDDSLKGTAGWDITPNIPDLCSPSKDYGKKCQYKYRVSCNPIATRRRLREESKGEEPPEGSTQRETSRFLFAKNLIDKCPGLVKEGRVFENFKFGGTGKGYTRAIPVHARGKEPTYPAKIARHLLGDETALPKKE